MKKEQLEEILQKHEKWINGDPDGRRADLHWVDLHGANLHGVDLQGANLCKADLHGANLRGANLHVANLCRADLYEACLCMADLRGANLRRANLIGADLDFSSWPLCCGSLDVKVDARIAAQLAYHFCRLDCDDPEYLAARNAVAEFANKFHRVEECGRIEEE